MADYLLNANAGELNKWICLSIQWNMLAGNHGYSVWCNGQKLCNFICRVSRGSSSMSFGDLNRDGIYRLDGSINSLH